MDTTDRNLSQISKVYGDIAPSFSTVKQQSVEFKCGHTNLDDDYVQDM